MSLKIGIIKFVAYIIAKPMRMLRLVYNQVSTASFQKMTICQRDSHVNYPVYVRGGQYITVENGFFANRGLRIECLDEYFGYKYTPKLTIGKNVSFGCQCHIGCVNRIDIGNNVLCGSNVLIIDHSHGRFDDVDKDVPWIKRCLYSKGAIVIDDNVWIGDDVSVLPNVKIGKGSVIGAGSIVTKDIPPYSLAVGNPAKVIRQIEI